MQLSVFPLFLPSIFLFLFFRKSTQQPAALGITRNVEGGGKKTCVRQVPLLATLYIPIKKSARQSDVIKNNIMGKDEDHEM